MYKIRSNWTRRVCEQGSVMTTDNARGCAFLWFHLRVLDYVFNKTSLSNSKIDYLILYLSYGNKVDNVGGDQFGTIFDMHEIRQLKCSRRGNSLPIKHALSLVAQWLERTSSIWKTMGFIPVGDSEFVLSPTLLTNEHSIFTMHCLACPVKCNWILALFLETCSLLNTRFSEAGRKAQNGATKKKPSCFAHRLGNGTLFRHWVLPEELTNQNIENIKSSHVSMSS